MFRVQRRPGVPRLPSLAEQMMRIINAEPSNEDRPMLCEMLARMQRRELGAPLPVRPRVVVNDPMRLPRAMALAMEAMDDRNNAKALICLRERNNIEVAEEGINHSL